MTGVALPGPPDPEFEVLTARQHRPPLRARLHGGGEPQVG